jgi:hypothetical protein
MSITSGSQSRFLRLNKTRFWFHQYQFLIAIGYLSPRNPQSVLSLIIMGNASNTEENRLSVWSFHWECQKNSNCML